MQTIYLIGVVSLSKCKLFSDLRCLDLERYDQIKNRILLLRSCTIHIIKC